ncbi:MAG TPA: methyltransferase dimerization domain-containing protein [Candidatus Dormibacteraeota bacterium]|nr:methyltransferase dimerization domain-containing protein [Candidatus Dormibacteraeota bacterium]
MPSLSAATIQRRTNGQGHTEPPSKPPHVQLIEMGTAQWISRIIFVAAKLGLADHLAQGPKSADELARRTGTHAPSLRRLMRTLEHLGLMSEGPGQCFSLTPLGAALKRNAPGSAYAAIITFGSEWFANGF